MAQTDPGRGDASFAAGAPSSRASAQRPANGRAAGDSGHAGPVSDATLLELLGRIVNDLSDLVDKQIQLAKQEVREDLGEVAGAARALAVGAGIVAAVGLLLVIWLWTAVIWLFNWLGALLWSPYGGALGWIVGLVVPLLVALFAYNRFIKRGLRDIRIKPLERTRATLKEDLEWVRRLRTRDGR